MGNEIYIIHGVDASWILAAKKDVDLTAWDIDTEDCEVASFAGMHKGSPVYKTGIRFYVVNFARDGIGVPELLNTAIL